MSGYYGFFRPPQRGRGGGRRGGYMGYQPPRNTNNNNNNNNKRRKGKGGQAQKKQKDCIIYQGKAHSLNPKNKGAVAALMATGFYKDAGKNIDIPIFKYKAYHFTEKGFAIVALNTHKLNEGFNKFGQEWPSVPSGVAGQSILAFTSFIIKSEPNFAALRKVGTPKAVSNWALKSHGYDNMMLFTEAERTAIDAVLKSIINGVQDQTQLEKAYKDKTPAKTKPKEIKEKTTATGSSG